MATVAAKMPDPVAAALRRKAAKAGKTSSEVIRELVEEWIAPPSDEWMKVLRKMPRLDPGKRRKRPADVDELTWAIDTMEP